MIKFIELFAGIKSQREALKRANIEYKIAAISKMTNMQVELMKKRNKYLTEAITIVLDAVKCVFQTCVEFKKRHPIYST